MMRTIFPQSRVRNRLAVVCAGCGRQVARTSHRQQFCSTKCRMQENGRGRVRKASLGLDTGAPTIGQKNNNKNSPMQGANLLSPPRILASAQVLAVELLDRDWKPAISSDGIHIEIAELRPRSLVSP